MRRSFVLGAFLLFFITVFAGFVSAAENRYENNTAGETSAGGYSSFGQVFTIGATAPNTDFYITNLSVFINGTGQGIGNTTVTIQGVSAGLPDGVIYAAGTWNADAAIDRSVPSNVSFFNRTVLRASQQYAFVFSTGTNVAVSQNGAYPGGDIFSGGAVQSGVDMRFILWGNNDTIFVETGSAGNLSSVYPTVNATLFGFTRVSFANATALIWNSTGALVNTTFMSVSGNTTNVTTFQIANLPSFKTYTFNVLGCGGNGLGNNCTLGLNRSFFLGALENVNSYNTTTYETALEGFLLNLSIASSSVQSASLWYNGINSSGTVSISNGNYIISESLDVPTTGTLSWFWSILLASGETFNLTTRTQTSSAINFTLCGSSPQNVPYINLTFKNETTALQTVNASISSTWYYYLGTGSVNKTLSYTNTSENLNYAFCFSPPSRTLYTDPIVDYYNTGSPQRTYAPNTLTLTNATTSQTLYLLPTSDGIYSSIQTTTTQGSVIQGVNVLIERQIGSSFVTISSDYTDSSGLVTFWVNPNFQYRVTATKSGYQTAQVTITPSQSQYTLFMSTSSGNATYSDDLQGIQWITFPLSGPVNQTSLFGMNLTASLGNLEACKLDLVRSDTGATLTSITGTATAYGCNISSVYTLPSEVRVFGKHYVQTTTSDGYILIDADTLWLTIETNASAWNNLQQMFVELSNLPEFGTSQIRNEFNRIIFFYFTLFLLLGLLTFFTEYDRLYPGFFIVIIWAAVLVASDAGFLTITLSETANPSFSFVSIDSLEQWTIGIITTMFTVGYLLSALAKQLS